MKKVKMAYLDIAKTDHIKRKTFPLCSFSATKGLKSTFMTQGLSIFNHCLSGNMFLKKIFLKI